MHATDWAEAQKEDSTLSAVLNWLKAQKKTNLKALLAEHTSSKEGRLILHNWQNFMVHQGTLYLHSMPKGETKDLLLFVVPRPIGLPPWMCVTKMWVIRDATVPYLCCGSVSGGQAWPIRCNILLSPVHIACNMRVICPKCPTPDCGHCPLDLLHVDFTSIEMTLELIKLPKVTNLLVFQDHFTKHVMAYVTPNQTVKMVAKFLYQGYISIFRAPARLLSDWGATFLSSIIDDMCNLLDMKKLQTMPYHSQTNGLVEWSHQTIMWMIRKLGEDKKAHWPGHLAEILHAWGIIHII